MTEQTYSEKIGLPDDVDQELLDAFLEETTSLIASLEENLLELDNNSADGERLASLFRILHSIKGNTSLFGFQVGRTLAHGMEDYLSLLKEDPGRVDRGAVSLLFKGFDLLQEYFNGIFDGHERKALDAKDNSFLNQLQTAIETFKSHESQHVCRLLQEFKDTLAGRLQEHPEQEVILIDLDQMMQQLNDLEASHECASGPGNASAGKGGDDAAEADDQEILHILSQAAKGSPVDNGKLLLEKALGRMMEALSSSPESGAALEALEEFQSEWEVLVGDETTLDELAAADLFERWEAFIKAHVKRDASPPPEDGQDEMDEEAAEETDEAPEPDENPSEESQSRMPVQAKRPESRKFMRVDERKIDGFMQYVGELIVTTEMFNHLERCIMGLHFGNREVEMALKNLSVSFNTLSDNLQKSLLAVRRVPLKNLFTKLRRIARDIAQDLGKHILFQVMGEEEEIDKSLIELLDAPLVHLVRNCIDHGIESGDDRCSAGKPEQGMVRLAAVTEGEYLVLTLSDDGQGINVEKVRKKVVEQGLASQEEAAALNQEQLYKYIFMPGFSSADSITNVSGRGVGMDVVKTNIAQAGGEIALNSKTGEGTEIRLKLPLAVTVTVKSGLIIRVGRHEFLVAVEDIVEAFSPEAGSISTVQGTGEVVRLRDRLFPLIRLSDVLSIPEAGQDALSSTCLVVSTYRGERVIMIDEIKGQQQVVMQDLGKVFTETRGFEGAAIRGNGEVGLLIDINQIVNMVEMY